MSSSPSSPDPATMSDVLAASPSTGSSIGNSTGTSTSQLANTAENEHRTAVMDTSDGSLAAQPQSSTDVKPQQAEEHHIDSADVPQTVPAASILTSPTLTHTAIHTTEATTAASSPSSFALPATTSSSSSSPASASPTASASAAPAAAVAAASAATATSPLPTALPPSSSTTTPTTADRTSTAPLSPPPSPLNTANIATASTTHSSPLHTPHRPAASAHHSDSEDTTVESYTPSTTQPTRITVQLPRKTHADVVFYHLPTHRDALHHLSILRHIINASEHTDDNTAITYDQYARNPHTKKFYQATLPLPASLDPLPFTVRCLVRCLNRVSQQKKVVDVEHVLPSERSAHVYSTLRLQVIQLYGSHPPVYPFAPTSIAPSPPAAVTVPPAAPSIAAAAPPAPTAAATAADGSSSSISGSSSSSSSNPGVSAAAGNGNGSAAMVPTLLGPGAPLPIPPEKQRPTDVVFFYLASYNDVMYHNSILSNVLHAIGQKDDKAYVPYSLYLASPRTTEHYPTGPPLQPSCDPIPFTLRGVLSCLARVRRQRRAQKTQLTSVEPLERNGVVYARIREQVFRLYDGQPPSMAGLAEGPKRAGSGGSSGRRGKGVKRAAGGDDGDGGDDRMDEADDDELKVAVGSGTSSRGLTTPSLSRNLSASSDDSVPGSPGSSPPSTSSEPDMLDHLLNASAAVNGSEVKLMKVRQRREKEKERRRKRMREGGGSDGSGKAKEMRVKVEGDRKADKGDRSDKGENDKERAEGVLAPGEAAGKVGVNGGAGGGESVEKQREQAERLYSKLSEHGSALPDRDTFLKLWEASH